MTLIDTVTSEAMGIISAVAGMLLGIGILCLRSRMGCKHVWGLVVSDVSTPLESFQYCEKCNRANRVSYHSPFN